MNYSIVGYSEGRLEIKVGEVKFEAPVPIVNGKFIEGEELQRFIKDTVAGFELRTAPVLPKNDAHLKALVVNEVFSRTELERDVQTKRGKLLRFTDWVMSGDSPVTPEMRQKWQKYRKELRDLTKQAGYPTQVKWPVPPEVVNNFWGDAETDAQGVPVRRRKRS